MDREQRRPCVIGYFDVVGIREMLEHGKDDATGAMRRLEENAANYARSEQHWYDGIYVWNDSVLVVIYLQSDTGTRPVDQILRNLDRFRIHLANRSMEGLPPLRIYGICVKGEAFVPSLDGILFPVTQYGSVESKYVFIRASSLAVKNAFEVEAKLGKKHQREWYIDSRLYGSLPSSVKVKLTESEQIKLYADPDGRSMYMGDGNLFDSSDD